MDNQTPQPNLQANPTDTEFVKMDDFVNHKHRDYDKTPRLTILESDITLADNTTDDVSSTKHGFAPKSPGDATKFLNGGATPGWTTPKGSFDYQVFTADGTWNKPANASATSMVLVQLWGGGGGSGGANNTGTTDAGGGGGAEYTEGIFRASDLNSTVSIVISTGGTAGAAAGGDGGNGASSTFGTTLVIAKGGLGGKGSILNGAGGDGGGYNGGLQASGKNARDQFSGGAGGTNFVDGNGGTATKGGGGGGAGRNSGGISQQGGNGADGPSGNGVGVAGNAPGGGASGASQNGAGTKAGAVGGRGECRVWTFFA